MLVGCCRMCLVVSWGCTLLLLFAMLLVFVAVDMRISGC